MKNNSSLKENFGQYIRRLRIEQKIGQRDLAKKIGIAPSYLNDIEKSKRAAPKQDVIKKIAIILMTNVNDLNDLAGISKNESFLQEQTTKLSGQLSETFTTLEANAKEQIRSNVEKEFISVKKVIETYRQERFAIVDNQILSLIEKTTSIALGKNLTLHDHTDLIYKSLDEAKSKNVFT